MFDAGREKAAGPGDVERVRVAAEKWFSGARSSHDWDHTRRVLRLCRRIGPREGADMDVLCIAALLHDIGRREQDRSNGVLCHAAIGAELAAPIVADLALSKRRGENILHCIRSHRYRGDHAPATVEARVLFDADKLDAIGAVGVARAYLFAGELGAKLHNSGNDIAGTRRYSSEDTGYREFKVKLCRIRERMLTETGRRLAEDRHHFMVAFFQRFIDEVEGRL